MTNPTVSIIVPCRNEIKHIENFINDVLSQDYENFTIEIIIADGGSTDGTRQYLDKFAQSNQFLRWIDNPAKIVSTGLNLAVAAASGEFIVRMDVHSTYAKDYVKQCFRALIEIGATCVGGAWVAEGSTPMQRAIAAAFQSRIGSGGAASRRANYSGWVDTVYLGAWRRSDLISFGGFDETLVRNQDDELCLRILRNGGGVWQSSDIRSVYKPRESLIAVGRQFSQYGYWKIPVIQKHNMPASVRHIIPFSFAVVLISLLFLALFYPLFISIFLGFVSIYIMAIFWGTRKERAALDENDPSLITIVAVTFMHFGYAIGFGYAIWDFIFMRKIDRKAMQELTR